MWLRPEHLSEISNLHCFRRSIANSFILRPHIVSLSLEWCSAATPLVELDVAVTLGILGPSLRSLYLALARYEIISSSYDSLVSLPYVIETLTGKSTNPGSIASIPYSLYRLFSTSLNWGFSIMGSVSTSKTHKMQNSIVKCDLFVISKDCFWWQRFSRASYLASSSQVVLHWTCYGWGLVWTHDAPALAQEVNRWTPPSKRLSTQNSYYWWGWLQRHRRHSRWRFM